MRFFWCVFFSTLFGFEPTYGRDPATTDYYLITAGPSYGLHTQGGHSLIRVHNTKTGEDKVYNWGTFDFDEPGFEWKFYQGSLLYRMSVLPTQRWLAYDMRRNPRYTIQDKLNLTHSQKQSLDRELRWWENPENNGYLYHIWDDNCSTKIRDILNKILQNQIYNTYSTRLTRQTYRELWTQTFAHWSSVVFAVNLTLNHNADQVTSSWERMFIPEYMRLSLSDMPAIDDGGDPRPELLLSTSPTLLADSPPTLDPYKPWEGWISFIWALGAALTGLCFLRRWGMLRRLTLTCAVISWALPSGILGCLLLLNSFLTTREYLYLPPTLWLFWPTDLLVLIAIPAWLRGQLPNHNRGYGRFLFLTCRAHFIGHCFYLGLWLTQVIHADIRWLALTMAPASLFVIASIDRLGLRYRLKQPSAEILAQIKEAQNAIKD